MFDEQLKDMEKTLLTREQITQRISELGAQLTEEYRDKNPLMVCTLRGAVLFFADLIRQIDAPLELDFISASSYGAGTDSSGVVRINKDLSTNIKGRHVVIVEDIIDTGLTLTNLLALLRTRQPASIKICALLSKPSRRKVDLVGDYIGFEIPDEFAVGFGLDYDERYRNLDSIYTLNPSVYGK